MMRLDMIDGDEEDLGLWWWLWWWWYHEWRRKKWM